MDEPAKDVLDTEVEGGKPTGQVYWIRHGESEGNEKNVFSGVVDFRLTRFGQTQATQAGADLTKKFGSKGGQFDAVYTSNLYRAIRTKELALREDEAEGDPSKRSPMLKDTTVQKISTEICERSQGIFTGENKGLVMALLGADLFVEFLESPSHCPLGGESGGEIYDRCKAFYEREIQPRVDRGENVLVVCHEFVIMGMVCYLTGKERHDFIEFKVPNGKAMSSDDLKKLLSAETDAFNEFLKRLGNWTTINALFGAALLFVLGGLLRVATQSKNGMPGWCYRTLIVGLNYVSCLYTYLDVDLLAVTKNVSVVAVVSVISNVFFLRWALAIIALRYGDPSEGLEATLLDTWMLYLMMPPGMTSPGVARLTGGNVYETATLSPVLSIFLPLLLQLFAHMDLIPSTLFNTEALAFYWSVLAIGLFFPCALSQYVRYKSPVEVAKHTKRWSFLTGWALMGLGFAGGYQTCPIDFFTFIRDVNSSNCKGYNLSSLSWAIGIWLGLRMVGVLWTTVLKHTTGLLERQLVDIFILVATPNIFLWLALADSNGSLSNIINFWAGFFWFGGIAYEQYVCVSKVGRKLCRAAVGGSVMSPEKVNELLDRFDIDGDNTLDNDEFEDLLKHFYRNSGEPVPPSELLDLLVRKLMKHMGQDENGKVPIEAVRQYLLGNGLYVNMNSPSEAPSRTRSRSSRHRSTRFGASILSKRFLSAPPISKRVSLISGTSPIVDHQESMWGLMAHGDPAKILEGFKNGGFLEEHGLADLAEEALDDEDESKRYDRRKS